MLAALGTGTYFYGGAILGTGAGAVSIYMKIQSFLARTILVSGLTYAAAMIGFASLKYAHSFMQNYIGHAYAYDISFSLPKDFFLNFS